MPDFLDKFDFLKPLPVQQVAAWYGRLADLMANKPIQDDIDGISRPPLSATLLRHYLDNRDPEQTFVFDPPSYLREATEVKEVLAYHRKVFLSEEPAPGGAVIMGKRYGKIAGLVPRLRGDKGFGKVTPPALVPLRVESLVEIAGDPDEIKKLRKSGIVPRMDLFASLRGFQLRSEIMAHVLPSRAQRGFEVRLLLWRCQAKDVYDFDYDEGLILPNPDFGSRDKGAVAPEEDQILVRHRNAKRIEDAHLAAPYPVESRLWMPLIPSLYLPAEITL